MPELPTARTTGAVGGAAAPEGMPVRVLSTRRRTDRNPFAAPRIPPNWHQYQAETDHKEERVESHVAHIAGIARAEDARTCQPNEALKVKNVTTRRTHGRQAAGLRIMVTAAAVNTTA